MRKKISLPRGWKENHLPDTTPGERLKKCRVVKNLTQAHFAFLTDTPQTTISRMERGKAFFSTEDAKIFAEVLETTSEYLLYGAPKNEGGGWKTRRMGKQYMWPSLKTEGTSALLFSPRPNPPLSGWRANRKIMGVAAFLRKPSIERRSI